MISQSCQHCKIGWWVIPSLPLSFPLLPLSFLLYLPFLFPFLSLHYPLPLSSLGKFSVSELHWKFQELTEMGRITVVMYVSNQFVDGKLQLTDFRDPSRKLGFWVGTRLEQQKRAKNAEI